MASNNTVVISFSIALFLLLILLLLITYNSKCQMDNVENFLGNPVESINRDMEMLKTNTSVGKRAQESSEFSVNKAIGHENEFYEDNIHASDPAGNTYNQVVNTTQENVVNTNMPEAMKEVEETVQSTDCFPRDKLTSDDLLPSDANSTWAKVNPVVEGDMTNQNFLNAGHWIGINTVGQSLRNANRQLRYEPPNPQVAVSPWQISTIEPDNRMNGLLDIGAVASSHE